MSKSLLSHLSEFGAGMAAAAWLHGRTLSTRASVAVAAAGVACVMADAIWHPFGIGPHELRSAGADLPAAVGFAMVIVALSAVGSSMGTVLTLPPVQWLGTISYALYLWHYMVIIGLRGTGRWPTALLPALTATIALSCVAAALSWHLVEQPALRWARRRAVPHRAQRHAPLRARPTARAEVVGAEVRR